MKSVLITGFSPFLGSPVNPSQKIVECLAADEFGPTSILPVSFAGSVEALQRLRRNHKTDFILMLGQATGRAKISLERVALNWVETRHPDETGLLPPPGPIDPTGPTAVISPLPLANWCRRLEAAGVPAEVSLSAGGYVCNHLLYHAVRGFDGAEGRALFVHVPLLPEQANESQPSMPLETMVTGVRLLIDEISG